MDFDPQKDYYKLLWLSEDASEDEIKKAFRKLAVQHHPDRWGDQAKFQEINEAHQTLSDQQKRQQYDTIRKGWGGFGGFWWWGGGFGGFWWAQVDLGDLDLWDLMGWFFGGGNGWGSRRSQKGEDIKIGINITFDESFLWAEKDITYKRMTRPEWVEETTCSTCDGRGQVIQQTQTPFGVMQVQKACHACGWSGKIFTKNGKELRDGWREKKDHTITIKIPPAIKDGTFIKYSWMGNDTPGAGSDGDLYIKISIKESPIFERKDNDVYGKVDVTLFDLVLGTKRDIDHPEGKITIKIPKGTQPDALIKVTGKWFSEKWMFTNKGDMYLKPKISIPKKLSKEQEKLWKELQEKTTS